MLLKFCSENPFMSGNSFLKSLLNELRKASPQKYFSCSKRIAIRVICVSIMERIITMVDYIGRQNNRLSSRRLHRAVTKNTYLPCSKAKVIVVRSATSAGPKYWTAPG